MTNQYPDPAPTGQPQPQPMGQAGPMDQPRPQLALGQPNPAWQSQPEQPNPMNPMGQPQQPQPAADVDVTDMILPKTNNGFYDSLGMADSRYFVLGGMRQNLLKLIAYAGALLVLIGVFLPAVTVKANIGTTESMSVSLIKSKDGIDLGIVILILAVVAVVFTVLRKKIFTTIAFATSIAALVMTVICMTVEANQISQAKSALSAYGALASAAVSVVSGPGPWITLLGCLDMVVATLGLFLLDGQKRKALGLLGSLPTFSTRQASNQQPAFQQASFQQASYQPAQNQQAFARQASDPQAQSQPNAFQQQTPFMGETPEFNASEAATPAPGASGPLCPQCGAPVKSDSNFCTSCGASLKA